MDRKQTIHNLIRAIAFEVLEFIRNEEGSHPDGWIPAADIKK